MLKCVLLAYDGSDGANRAFERALDLARTDQAQLHVLSVADAVEVETHVVTDHQRQTLTDMQGPLCVRAMQVSVPVTLEVVAGVPAQEIVRAAARIRADLIIMGHRRRDLLQRYLRASVVKRVLDQAPCAVLVIPDAGPRS